MKYFVTGTTGFIAGELARELLRQGHEVVALVRNPDKPKAQQLASEGITVVKGDVTDKSTLIEPMQGTDVVFHLAAAQHEANVDDDYFWNINVGGTRNMLDAAIETGVKRFVHASTIGVYGEAKAGTLLNEQSPTNPLNVYTRSKFEAESIVRSYGNTGKIPVTVIRSAETYGPGDMRLLKLFKQINKGRFFRIGPGENIHHLTYIDDLVAGYIRAANSEEAENNLFVLAGADRPTTDEMLDGISKAVGKSLLPIRVPLWVFDTAAIVLESTLQPLGIQPPLHRRRMDFFKKEFAFDTTHAQETIGYDPQVPWREGVQHTAKWYREKGLI
jgi:nucleoside-diphosphate-sugar epimerase